MKYRCPRCGAELASYARMGPSDPSGRSLLVTCVGCECIWWYGADAQAAHPSYRWHHLGHATRDRACGEQPRRVQP